MLEVPEVAAEEPTPCEPVDEATSDVNMRVAHHAPDTVVVHVSGALDLTSTPHLALVLKPRLKCVASTLVVDLSRVEFVGSAALQLLIHAHHQAVHHGMNLRLVDGPRCVRRALHAAGRATATRFAIYPDVPTAVDIPKAAAPTWTLRRTGAVGAAHLAGQARS